MEEMSFARKSLLVLLGVAIWCAALGALIALSGCTTTPEPVVQANQMALHTLDTYGTNVDSVVDAYVTYCIAADNRWYDEQFANDMTKIVSPDGTVDLLKYTQLQQAYDVEKAKVADYHKSRGADLKGKLDKQLVAIKVLLNANTAWLEAAGISQEQFQQLVDSTFMLGGTIAASIDANKPPSTSVWDKLDALPGQMEHIQGVLEQFQAQAPPKPENLPSLQDLIDRLKTQKAATAAK